MGPGPSATAGLVRVPVPEGMGQGGVRLPRVALCLAVRSDGQRDKGHICAPILGPEASSSSALYQIGGQQSSIHIRLFSNRKNLNTSALKDMTYYSFHSLETLNVILGLKGLQTLLGSLWAKKLHGGTMPPTGLSWTTRPQAPQGLPPAWPTAAFPGGAFWHCRVQDLSSWE